ncbi:C2 domain-containing protein [Hirschfeldia incana]|nr:C2 domain-containing protein [Hirschfeldia incana]
MSRESLLSAEKPMPRERPPVSSPSVLEQKGMTTRTLEITAVSAEGLLDGQKPVNKNAFVAFDIAGNYCNREMRTEVCGEHPVWKEKLETEFSSPPSEKKESFMYVRVYCEIYGGKDKHVGTARVPIKDFTGEYAPEGFLQCLSYRLWDDYGKKNGIVNFSARIVPVTKPGLRPFWLR